MKQTIKPMKEEIKQLQKKNELKLSMTIKEWKEFQELFHQEERERIRDIIEKTDSFIAIMENTFPYYESDDLDSFHYLVKKEDLEKAECKIKSFIAKIIKP